MPRHTLPTPLLLCLPVLALTGCNTYAGPAFERQLDRTFTVPAGSSVRVDLGGGSITAETGPVGTVEVIIKQAIDAGSEQEAQSMGADYELSAVQTGSEIRAVSRRKPGVAARLWHRDGVQLSARVIVPPDAKLELATSGGSIRVHGDRTGAIKAQTSGGSVTADGANAGPLTLGTSGGSIHVGRTLGGLRANTSGGGITVEYVGPSKDDVTLDTSGGSIHVGVDSAAAMHVDASTSGGSVRVHDLTFESNSSADKSHVTGTINGGGARLRAHTSGGSVTIGPPQ